MCHCLVVGKLFAKVVGITPSMSVAILTGLVPEASSIVRSQKAPRMRVGTAESPPSN